MEKKRDNNPKAVDLKMVFSSHINPVICSSDHPPFTFSTSPLWFPPGVWVLESGDSGMTPAMSWRLCSVRKETETQHRQLDQKIRSLSSMGRVRKRAVKKASLSEHTLMPMKCKWDRRLWINQKWSNCSQKSKACIILTMNTPWVDSQ